MKKLILTILIAGCATFAAQAQSIHFGVKGGLNIAQLSDFDGSGSRASGHVGGFVNFRFRDWAIQPELLFSGQGEKYDVALAGERKVALNYINIPVMFQYYLIPQFYLEAGPQVGFLVSAKDKGGSVTVDIKDGYNTADLGMGFGLGFKLPMGFGIYGRYNFGLTDLYDGSGDYKNSVAQVGVSYTIK
ncbi:porin family protein [Chitinophaga japonensis]|uniref:Outer membrane protein with beta-barrel domain n=1 Tax=Chitinophaga japonensis TaxID=104662 RepID=A0A562T518_CHIJA|nr:porin family protein [Chitinophaga japonensis]TWI88637.1 outer membrane protein with beta-barrel domain [Chitinophaga japonensis]